jgi:FAD/FMN-containing dehydrogenase
MGERLRPGDPGYDDARRGYNLLHDLRPAVIVRPVDGGDVARALELAAGAGLEVAVRSGGHSLAGYGGTEGGLLIDLSAMRAIEIDPAARVAWVEAGVTAGQLTEAAAAHGLVVPFGDSPDVGVGGITLGGGVGWLSRKLGLTVDSVEGVELVTADGQDLQVDDEHHPDLFWAIRGGGGNFGVVTSLTLKTHRAAGAAYFFVSWPWSQAGEALAAWQRFAPEAPPGLTSILSLAAGLSEELRGLIALGRGRAASLGRGAGRLVVG